MTRPWLFLYNVILNACEGSYRLAVRISTFHIAALLAASGDLFFLGLYNTYKPFHEALILQYNSWIAQGGTQSGQTLSLTTLFKQLRQSKIQAWMAAVAVVYPIDTLRYKAIFLHGKAPFSKKSQTTLIANVMALSTLIGTDILLASVQLSVTNFYTNLNAANISQKGSKTSTKTMSSGVLAAVTAMAIEQFGNLGSLIRHFAATPLDIAPFFDLIAIRYAKQILFTGLVKKLSPKTIAKRTFLPAQILKLENPGTTTLWFYMAAVKGAHAGATYIILLPGETIDVPVTALGPLTSLYLMVYNPDTTTKGQYLVEVL
jgi:hypothetical protein